MVDAKLDQVYVTAKKIGLFESDNPICNLLVL